MLIVQHDDSVGLLGIAERLCCALVFMGLWWAGFTLPTLFVLRDRGTSARQTTLLQTVRLATSDVATTLRHTRSLSVLTWFLLGFLFYNDGVQTAISQASTFAL